MPRLTRFGFPSPSRSLRQPESRVEIFDPTFGFHSGEPPQDLRPGFTPESRNFVIDGNFLTPRSGLSHFLDFSLGGAALGGTELFDLNGRANALAASAASVAYFERDALSWSTLSYIRGSTLASDDALSGLSNEYHQIASIYEPAATANIAVFTNGRNFPKFSYIQPSLGTFSDFTFGFSIFSKAKSVAAFDNRLVWFNVDDSAASRPTRVVWSNRGNPLNYTIAEGAGAEDLIDMKGVGQRIIPEADGILLFSDEEIWRGRPRLDAYAFDFYPLAQYRGCPYPQTIIRTPFGTAFLGRDLEVYMVSGQAVQPLGPTQAGRPSRIQRHLRSHLTRPDRAWATYNQTQRRYELYFTTSESTEGFPVRALYLHLENGSWFEQRFSHELSYGFELEDSENPLTWDDIDEAWNDYDAVTWDDPGGSGFGRLVGAFGSAGTAYRFRSDQTNDDGRAIDCRWRSHALNSRDQLRFDQLYEVNVELEAPSASSLSVMVSDDLGASFLDGFGISLSASSITNAFAPVWVSGRAPLFELRLNDGGQPRIARLQARLRDTGLYGGGR